MQESRTTPRSSSWVKEERCYFSLQEETQRKGDPIGKYMELLGNMFPCLIKIKFGRLLLNFRLNTSFMFISDT